MANLNKVLIIGGEGTIGKELNFGIKVTHNEVNIEEKDSIRKAIKKYRPSSVLNLASLNLRNCEKDLFLATKINVEGMINVCSVAEEFNIPVIMISSGAVFNGTKEEAFHEHSVPFPKNVYGVTKYLGERIVHEYKKGIVVRTGWLFGFTHRSNFFNLIYNKLKNEETLSATYDQNGSFTSFADFQEELKKIILNEERGIYHIANTGKASAYDFAIELKKLLKSKATIIKKSIEEDEKEGPSRSRSEVLTSEKIKMRDWMTALSEHMKLSN